LIVIDFSLFLVIIIIINIIITTCHRTFYATGDRCLAFGVSKSQKIFSYLSCFLVPCSRTNFFIQNFFLSPTHTKTMSEETKEKRFDDYSQDENVERHTRKNRWVSVDIGGKP